MLMSLTYVYRCLFGNLVKYVHLLCKTKTKSEYAEISKLQLMLKGRKKERRNQNEYPEICKKYTKEKREKVDSLSVNKKVIENGAMKAYLI